MRYNKMHNVNTILNNKAQLRVFFCKISLWFQSGFAICSLLRIFMKLWWRIFFLHQMYGSCESYVDSFQAEAEQEWTMFQ